jgi:hypothetical protein
MADSKKKRSNNSRKAAARALQRRNPGMSYTAALALTPEPGVLAARRLLHRGSHLSAALVALEAALDVRVRQSAPDEPFVTAEVDAKAALTGLWLVDIRRRYRLDQIGALVVAAIGRCTDRMPECKRLRVDAALRAHDLSSSDGGSESGSGGGDVVDDEDRPQGLLSGQEFVVTVGSVTVRVDGRGRITDIEVADSCNVGDGELADVIVVAAGLAQARYRMELRLRSLEAASAAGLDTARFDEHLREACGMPTPEEYEEVYAAVLGQAS